MIGLFRPEARYDRSWSGEVLVLSPGDIPTVDFYLRSRISSSSCRVHYALGSLSMDESPSVGTFVVIVRHASGAQLRWLQRHANAFCGVAYLMDDDIPAAWHCRDVPLDYGWWTSSRYWLIAGRLAALCDRIWVSTPELARRYPASRPRVVPPLINANEIVPAEPGCRRWGYHGTRIHHRELHWLVPLVELVHEVLPGVSFEVFGGQPIRQLFSQLPRVTVLSARNWGQYLEYCRGNRLAIGVAPLLPGRFNEARSHVKLFDMARCGALGVFSSDAPYADVLRGAGCRLVRGNVREWAEEICALFSDESQRLNDYEKTLAWIRSRGDCQLEALMEEAPQARP